jgi:hypothetical protein
MKSSHLGLFNGLQIEDLRDLFTGKYKKEFISLENFTYLRALVRDSYLYLLTFVTVTYLEDDTCIKIVKVVLLDVRISCFFCGAKKLCNCENLFS